MRILFVIDLAYPDHEGGSHRVCYEVARRLAARGHDVHLVSGGVAAEGTDTEEETVSGVVYHRLRRDRRNEITHALSYLLGARRAFERLGRRAPFDVVSGHYVLPTLGVLSTRRGRATPLVYSFHGPWASEYGVELEERWSGRPAPARWRGNAQRALALALARRLERLALARASRVHALSRYTAELATRLAGVPPDRTVIVPGGVDGERFRPAADREEVRRRLGLPLGRPILLTVRRLLARMGLANLVEAMRLVAQERPEALLLVAGRGPLGERLERLVAARGLADQVRFLGFVAHDELPAHYQAADCFVLPSVELEGFGLVTLEALASGTMVLGTPVGATAEILSPLDRRLLFDSARPDEMARGILRCLASPPVSAEDCRRYVLAHYSWDRTAEEMESLFTEAARSRA